MKKPNTKQDRRCTIAKEIRDVFVNRAVSRGLCFACFQDTKCVCVGHFHTVRDRSFRARRFPSCLHLRALRTSSQTDHTPSAVRALRSPRCCRLHLCAVCRCLAEPCLHSFASAFWKTSVLPGLLACVASPPPCQQPTPGGGRTCQRTKSRQRSWQSILSRLTLFPLVRLSTPALGRLCSFSRRTWTWRTGSAILSGALPARRKGGTMGRRCRPRTYQHAPVHKLFLSSAPPEWLKGQKQISCLARLGSYSRCFLVYLVTGSLIDYQGLSDALCLGPAP